MLVLSRKVGEKIIAGDIVFTVVQIRGDKVRIGITAPKEVPVHREEIHNLLHDPDRALACERCQTVYDKEAVQVGEK